MRYPEGQWANSTYDALDRLTTLQDSSVGSWSFVYDAASRRTRITHPSGLKTEYAYNKANWVTGVYTNTSGGSVVESFTYTYDKIGNRKTMVENGGNTSTYGYDATYRLKNESYTGGLVINYTYDGVGNRLTDVRNGVTTSYTYDADNRLTAQGSTTFGYDDNGNLIRKTVGGQNTTYAWDIENRLTQVTFPNATTVQYEYSTDGNRMSRTQGGVKTWYAYDFRDATGFEDVIGEYNATGALVSRYIHGPGADQPLGQVRGGTHFYSYDALGSATRLTTSSQTTNARYRCEAFGSPRDTLEGSANPYRFTGREFDPQAGLYYYRARWYDSTLGRFESKDPAGMVDGPNVYAYVGNNPVNRMDPSGKVGVCVFGVPGIYLIFDCLNTRGNPLWVVAGPCCAPLYGAILAVIIGCAVPPWVQCALIIIGAILTVWWGLSGCYGVCPRMDLVVRVCIWVVLGHSTGESVGVTL